METFQITFDEFKKMRKSIQKPLTPFAESLILKKLEKMTSNKENQIKILEQSIMNSWQGVWPLHEDVSECPF